MYKAQTWDDAAKFFAEHAGFSYDPKTETAEQGQIRTGRELAAAEMAAAELGWMVVWEDDHSTFDHKAEFGEAYDEGEPETCETASLCDREGDVIGSLSCVDDASDDYRRVVAAELAQQAMDENGTELAECGTCHRLFPDIYPAARCPFEWDHEEEEEEDEGDTLIGAFHTVRDALETIILSVSEDPAKTDLELFCTECGARLCDAEHEDSIGVLASIALDHVTENHRV